MYMTNEEAISEIESWTSTLLQLGTKCTNRTVEAQRMATKALEQESCEDAISREALDDAISNLTYWHFENGRLIPGGGGSKSETVYKVDDVTRLTHILPPVTQQLKKGQWIPGDSICPCCGEDKFKDLDADIWSDWREKQNGPNRW